LRDGDLSFAGDAHDQLLCGKKVNVRILLGQCVLRKVGLWKQVKRAVVAKRQQSRR
jgi:hypothetical protein